jgi:hypothetical protein
LARDADNSYLELDPAGGGPMDDLLGHSTLSARLLASGKRFCCLYTDVANPTSNAVYKRVGYAPIRDDVDIDFIELS